MLRSDQFIREPTVRHTDQVSKHTHAMHVLLLLYHTYSIFFLAHASNKGLLVAPVISYQADLPAHYIACDVDR